MMLTWCQGACEEDGNVDLCPLPSQVGLATYSYRSLPWLLLNRSSELPAVLEQIRTMRYEEPSGNAIGEGMC